MIKGKKNKNQLDFFYLKQNILSDSVVILKKASYLFYGSNYEIGGSGKTNIVKNRLDVPRFFNFTQKERWAIISLLKPPKKCYGSKQLVFKIDLSFRVGHIHHNKGLIS